MGSTTAALAAAVMEVAEEGGPMAADSTSDLPELDPVPHSMFYQGSQKYSSSFFFHERQPTKNKNVFLCSRKHRRIFIFTFFVTLFISWFTAESDDFMDLELLCFFFSFCYKKVCSRTVYKCLPSIDRMVQYFTFTALNHPL